MYVLFVKGSGGVFTLSTTIKIVAFFSENAPVSPSSPLIKNWSNTDPGGLK